MMRIAEFKKVSKEQFLKDYDSDIAQLIRAADPFADMYSENDIHAMGEEAYEQVRIPARATKGSAGYDIVSPVSFTLAPGDSIKFPTGLRCEIEEGWVLMIFPRSSLGFKYRLQLDNVVGVVDEDYSRAENEGHIFMKLTNDGKRGKKIEVKAGDRIAQGIFVPYGITHSDCATSKRSGGMGSTGK